MSVLPRTKCRLAAVTDQFDQVLITRRDTLLGAATLAAASALEGGSQVGLAPAIAQALPTMGAIDSRLGELEGAALEHGASR